VCVCVCMCVCVCVIWRAEDEKLIDRLEIQKLTSFIDYRS
jgi:hypothetical protein